MLSAENCFEITLKLQLIITAFENEINADIFIRQFSVNSQDEKKNSQKIN